MAMAETTTIAASMATMISMPHSTREMTAASGTRKAISAFCIVITGISFFVFSMSLPHSFSTVSLALPICRADSFQALH